jgi:hypothetical protein
MIDRVNDTVRADPISEKSFENALEGVAVGRGITQKMILDARDDPRGVLFRQ